MRFISTCCGLLLVSWMALLPVRTEAITLTIASYPNFDAAIRAAIPHYEKLHPDITIRLVALSFWFGSLFAEQIRMAQESYPFLELIGEPGAGKSTLLAFLWRKS